MCFDLYQGKLRKEMLWVDNSARPVWNVRTASAVGGSGGADPAAAAGGSSQPRTPRGRVQRRGGVVDTAGVRVSPVGAGSVRTLEIRSFPDTQISESLDSQGKPCDSR